ncbi:uncharacterized protein LOC118407570 [Branchiostoma floridae]|uniref:Uncharacterized protein LOC118407570 n=1 Tax=Branchiostoma floridae TaxID=7739 RepID=A0A9J7HT86_BRAFL|nr:uncharacterized protein LOC118407570 [Branchiostoma floridae]
MAVHTADGRAKQTNTTQGTSRNIFSQENLVPTSGGVTDSTPLVNTPLPSGVTDNTPLAGREGQRQDDKVPDSDAALARQESVVIRADSPTQDGSETRQTEYISEAMLLRQEDAPPRSVSVPYTRHDLARSDVPLTMTFMRPENLLTDRRSEFTDRRSEFTDRRSEFTESQGSGEPRTFSAYERQESGTPHGDSLDRMGALQAHVAADGASRTLDPLTFDRDHFAHMYRRDFLQQQREMFERSGVNVPTTTLMTLVEPAVPVNLAQDRGAAQDRSPGGAVVRGFPRSTSPARDAPRETPPLSSFSPLSRLPWEPPLPFQRQHPNAQPHVNRELSREAELLLSFSQTPGDMNMQ